MSDFSEQSFYKYLLEQVSNYFDKPGMCFRNKESLIMALVSLVELYCKIINNDKFLTPNLYFKYSNEDLDAKYPFRNPVIKNRFLSSQVIRQDENAIADKEDCEWLNSVKEDYINLVKRIYNRNLE